MSAAGTGELQFLEGTLNANMYCDILKQSMIPSLRRLGRRAVFQHDNDPKHTSKTTTALLKKLRVKVMDWPSMSPDLNPIEHLWGILKWKVEERKVSNIHQLHDVVMEEWKRTSVATCEALYLHKLFKRDHHKGQKYHEKQISLYAEYDRPNLLPFLRDSTHCPLEKALEICQQRNFVEETVYLLSRMGNSRSALKMIMEELYDVDKAIEFAKEQDDAELWEDLILYSIDKPPFITGLLNNIGTHVDPILLIHRIKEGMEIPNLRDSLVKILQDYNLQILLREGCKKILVADSLSLLKKMHRTQMRGVLVDGIFNTSLEITQTCPQLFILFHYENICETCLAPILPTDASKSFSITVFHCRHMFHKECFPEPSTESSLHFCNICSAKHRGPGSAILEMKK
ncbi:hypothetical protein EYD10_06233 [Varanus komodoensis]|nr:hypothetical protein EYD10_06233 [Varanus komodoensis]